MEILHVELVERTPSAFELRMWRENPNLLRTRTLPAGAVAPLLAAAQTDYYAPGSASLAEIGLALFRWLDGGERHLSAEIESSAHRTDVLVLAVAAPHGLAHLPWEALHDGRGFLLHAPNPPVLPVRWQRARPAAHPAANRPLQALFMASAPRDARPLLDYEWEEHRIVEATRRWPLELAVEESGSLEGLAALLHASGPGAFDVVHLTAHAGHTAEGIPVFQLEDGDGRCRLATAADLAREIPHRPPLLFLSGCRTAERPESGAAPSLAEELVALGFRAVLGWGRRVQDRQAIQAADHLYEHLAAGHSLPLSLARVHARLMREGAAEWHLLRLVCAGDPPAALVTSPRTPGRGQSVRRMAESEFLDPVTRQVPVAGRSVFRGRRRVLQRALGLLRQPEPGRAGVLLLGSPRAGKSSVAARLRDRLRAEFRPVIVSGRLDEPALSAAWAPELSAALRTTLLASTDELRFRIEAVLVGLAEEGRPPPLFVLDDLGRSQPDDDLTLAPEAAHVLSALVDALHRTGLGRVLVTSTKPLPAPFADNVETIHVHPLEAAGVR